MLMMRFCILPMSFIDSKHTRALASARWPSRPRRMLLHKKMLQRLQCNAKDMSLPRIFLHDALTKQEQAFMAGPGEVNVDDLIW
jgi:hypothetical protein